MAHRILIPENLAPDGLLPVQGRADIALERFPLAISQPAFRELLAGAHGAVLGLTPISTPELAVAPHLKVVARIGVGYDTIDVPALTARGIPLMITGVANSVSVAEQALAFMFAFAKRISELDAMVREHRWGARFAAFPSDLYRKRVVVVGFGRIGGRMAKRCVALEMDTLVYDPHVVQDSIRQAGATPAPDLDEAIAQADYVSIHCPKTPDTVGLFDAARIGRMKRGSVLINTARGGIVDEAALAQALRDGHLRGAGLDVFASEPTERDNPLLGQPHVIAAPHRAGVTIEAFNRMAETAMRNVVDVLDGRPNREHTVNPEVYG
jgi:D-3-phosphoglycerate dehydrogenase